MDRAHLMWVWISSMHREWFATTLSLTKAILQEKKNKKVQNTKVLNRFQNIFLP